MIGPRTDVGPFSIIPRWVWTACKAKPGALVVYACLADKADRNVDNGWTISRMELAAECEMSESGLDRMIKHLAGIGALVVINKRREDGMWLWSRYLIRLVDPEGGVLTSEYRVASPVNTGVPTSDDVPTEPITKTQTTRDEAFADFWSKYPTRPGSSKDSARKAWNRIPVKDHTVVMIALSLSVKTWEATRIESRFIPYAAKWLNEKRWENPPDPTAASPNVNGGRHWDERRKIWLEPGVG